MRSHPGTTWSRSSTPRDIASWASRPPGSTTSTCRASGRGCRSASPLVGRKQPSVCRAGPASRRAVYVLGSPLLPFVFLARCITPFLAARRAHRLPWLTLPTLVVGVAAVAAGELTAFLAGGRPGLQETTDHFELRKVDYTKPDA